MEELLEKIPAEKCWALTAQTLWRFTVLRGDKIFAPALGKGRGIIAPVLGAEKWAELTNKVLVDGFKRLFLQTKEMFYIQVEDAMGAANLGIVAGVLLLGPEAKYEIVETTPERVLFRWTKCPWWNVYKEFEVDHAYMPCPKIHKAAFKAGLKAVNPKITYKFTKAMPWGDPYCESVIEFSEE